MTLEELRDKILEALRQRYGNRSEWVEFHISVTFRHWKEDLSEDWTIATRVTTRPTRSYATGRSADEVLSRWEENILPKLDEEIPRDDDGPTAA